MTLALAVAAFAACTGGSSAPAQASGGAAAAPPGPAQNPAHPGGSGSRDSVEFAELELDHPIMKIALLPCMRTVSAEVSHAPAHSDWLEKPKPDPGPDNRATEEKRYQIRRAVERLMSPKAAAGRLVNQFVPLDLVDRSVDSVGVPELADLNESWLNRYPAFKPGGGSVHETTRAHSWRFLVRTLVGLSRSETLKSDPRSVTESALIAALLPSILKAEELAGSAGVTDKDFDLGKGKTVGGLIGEAKKGCLEKTALFLSRRPAWLAALSRQETWTGGGERSALKLVMEAITRTAGTKSLDSEFQAWPLVERGFLPGRMSMGLATSTPPAAPNSPKDILDYVSTCVSVTPVALSLALENDWPAAVATATARSAQPLARASVLWAWEPYLGRWFSKRVLPREHGGLDAKPFAELRRDTEEKIIAHLYRRLLPWLERTLDGRHHVLGTEERAALAAFCWLGVPDGCGLVERALAQATAQPVMTDVGDERRFLECCRFMLAAAAWRTGFSGRADDLCSASSTFSG